LNIDSSAGALKMRDFLIVYMERLDDWLPPLLRAAVVTIELAIFSILISLTVGFVIALARMSRWKLLSSLAVAYIECLRGTPALVQLYIVYFALPSIGVVFDSFTAAVITLGLNAAAYMAEIYRAGIGAIHIGQLEAALAIGMRPLQSLRFILLPQAWGIILPPTANLWVALVKDTSLASVIAAPELMTRSLDLVGQTWLPLHIYIVAGILYTMMCLPLGRLARALERRAHSGWRDEIG
jgi:polar amino acid transport system permease protein